MALDDIVFCEGEIVNFIVELPAGTLGTPSDILTEGGNAAGILCNEVGGGTYPSEGDVDLGVDYGPTGVEYEGTLLQPVESDVRLGVDYGADGTEFEGTYDAGGSAVYPIFGGSHVIQIRMVE